jgi:hypothetical protein
MTYRADERQTNAFIAIESLPCFDKFIQGLS